MRVEARKFLKSGTLKSGFSFASSGLSFAGANLILAHELTVQSYAVFALLIAIVMLSSSIGMLGADGIVNRHRIAPDMTAFMRVIITATVVGMSAAIIAVDAYGIPNSLGLLLVPTVVAFSISRFCGAFLQSRLRLMSSLLLFNSLNYLLLGVALLSMFTAYDDVGVLFPLITVSQCLVSVVALVAVRYRFDFVRSDYVYSWRESIAYLLMASCSEMLVQLERLVTPRFLRLEDLAVLGVLLAVIGPPFRLVYLTFGYGLLPMLRQARDRSRQVTVLLGHMVVALMTIVPLWALVWFGVPVIQRYYLSADYEMSGPLILAALVAGTIKAFSGIAQASVTALATVRSMAFMGIVGWSSVAVAVAAAWYGSRYGLEGVIWGVAVGWLIRSLVAFYVVAGQLLPENGPSDQLAATKADA